MKKAWLNWINLNPLIIWASSNPLLTGTKYSTTAISQDYRYFIEMPTTWVRHIEPDLPGSDFIPVRSTRWRYFAVLEARLHFKWNLFALSFLWFLLDFEQNLGSCANKILRQGVSIMDGRSTKEMIWRWLPIPHFVKSSGEENGRSFWLSRALRNELCWGRGCWLDQENSFVNLGTCICTSGNLLQPLSWGDHFVGKEFFWIKSRRSNKRCYVYSRAPALWRLK